MSESLLHTYLDKWNLKNPRLFAESTTGTVYEVEASSPLVLKIFTISGAKDEFSSTEALRLWNGVGAARLEKFDSGALLMERLPGPNLLKLSQLKGEAAATEIFASIIQKIHSAPSSKRGTNTLRTLLDPLQKRSTQNTLFAAADRVARGLLSTQTKEILLHGDLHHENVLMRESGEYVCIDPKGIWGDPAYELAAILKNPWGRAEISECESMCIARAEQFSQLLGYPLDRILLFAFVHMCLSAIWAIEDGADPAHTLKIATFLQKHKSIA